MATDSGQKFIRRNRAPRVHITYEDPYDAERLIELPFVMFPRKFLGINLTGLRSVMSRLRSKSIDIVFAFDEHNSRLAASVRPETFRLYTAPAINLFEKTSDRIPVKSNTYEYHGPLARSKVSQRAGRARQDAEAGIAEGVSCSAARAHRLDTVLPAIRRDARRDRSVAARPDRTTPA